MDNVGHSCVVAVSSRGVTEVLSAVLAARESQAVNSGSGQGKKEWPEGKQKSVSGSCGKKVFQKTQWYTV